MSKWKVYISSTFRDLKDFRAELINLFQNQLKNNFELCEIMERMFDDGTYTPFVNDCVEAVIESDIYIIILGNRTGSFPPDENRTYTEIELDTALEYNKRIFCLRLENFDETDIDNKIKHEELLNKFKGRPIHTFNDSVDLKNALYEFLIPFSSQTPVKQKNPYKGLASFNVSDGDYFFGRDVELESCLKKIITSSGNFFVSVIGNSGTGKSSFVMAGLMFRLKNTAELGFQERLQIIITPANEPFTNLKYQLQLQGISLEDILNPNSESPDLILFFDQFEEVITQCHTPEALEERKELFKFLDALASSQNLKSKVLVICTFRSDFLSQLANFDFIKSHQYLFPISSLDYKVHSDNWEQSMTEIITRPALKNGVVIEKELAEQMLEQIKEVDGSLPILQFTLERIWNEKTIQNRQINATEYSKLSEGKGISGIIETHAENVIKSITNKGQDKEREAILKTIFVNLVEVNENLNDVKRTVAKNDLFSILKLHPKQVVSEVFETLVSEKSRLLNVSQEKDETINVGIIHEELIRKWERLKGWIDERREALEHKKRITLDITAFNKGEEVLYGRKQLKRAYQWKVKNPDLANEEINSFLLNARRRNRHKLYKNSGIAVLAVALIAIVIFVWVQPIIQKRAFITDVLEPNTHEYNAVQGGGGIDSLTHIFIDQDNFSVYNGNLQHFGNLKTISIKNIPFLKDLSIIENIKNPFLVDSLIISHNDNLENLIGIEKLDKLTSLEISSNDNLENLTGIENLDKLTSLVISGNPKLENLTGIEKLGNLTSLVIRSNDNLENLTGIENLQSLTSLVISGNPKLENLAGIEKLDKLTSLRVTVNNKLENLTGLENLQNLTFLEIRSNRNLENLMGLENLQNLSSLVISSNLNLKNLIGIERLDKLTSLKIRDNYNLKNLTGIENLDKLTSLEIVGNKKLENLIGIENLKNLTSLVILRNRKLKNLTGIENLDKLTSLEIISIPGLENLIAIGKLDKLTSLRIIFNHKLKNLKGIENLQNLTSLEITSISRLKNLTGIEKLANLTSLEINYNDELENLTGIENLHNLTSLVIMSNHKVENLTGIENLQSLTSFVISSNPKLENLKGIENLQNLTLLVISNNSKLENLAGLENLQNLTSLVIKSNHKVENLTGIKNLDKLTSLVIGDKSKFENLIGLKNLTSLEILKIIKFENLISIQNLTNLSSLVISNNRNLENLTGIENLQNLTSLEIRENQKLENLTGLEKLDKLTSLVINLNSSLENLTGLENLKNLTSLVITSNLKLKNLTGIENLGKLKVLVLDRDLEIDVDLIIKNNSALEIIFK